MVGWKSWKAAQKKNEGILQAELCQAKCMVLGFAEVQTDPLWMEGKLQRAQ